MTPTRGPFASSRWALAALVAANLLPLAGVAVLGWRLGDVMVLYWLENGVIGAYTWLRILSAGGADSAVEAVVDGLGKLFVLAFFTVHYGLFWTVHGVFVLELFAEGRAALRGVPTPIDLGSWLPAAGGFGWALVGLVLSHGVSFVANWLGRGEYRGADARTVMMQPYGRVVVLHLVILLGGFLALALGQPLAALVLLVALKTGTDLVAHLAEHRGAAPRAATP